MLDLVLAIAHHILIFALFGVLLAEMMILRQGTGPDHVRRLAAIDGGYGGLATLVIVVGFLRAIFAAKGWDYYSHNGFFWAKLATFAVIGLISVGPTLIFIKARRAGAGLSLAQAARVRRLMHAQAGLFPLLLIFAAAMARGYAAF